MMNPKRFETHSLRNHPRGASVQRILAAALEAVDPTQAIHQHMQREGNHLEIGDQTFDLRQFARLLVIGFGKASLPMTKSTADVLGEALTAGVVITKGQVPSDKLQDAGGMSLLEVLAGAHPVPDESSVAGAQKIANLLSTTTEKDLVIGLISGGGSALLTLPVEGISLDDIQALTQTLLGCGATINEINCLRKHLSQVKGGQLAQMAAPAQMVNLILSDVVGDPLDVIASGPTVPDPTTFPDALEILARYGISDEIPAAILAHLQRGANGDIPETPKPGDPIFRGVKNTIIGNNYRAAQAALQRADAENFNSILLTTSLQGEAREAGKMLAAILRQVVLTGEPIPRPACIIAGGETTVTIHGKGLGGRNQELALAAVAELAGLSDVMLIALATDGDDGPTDAAGAVVTGETLGRATFSGLEPSKFLAANDAYHFFDPLGDLIKSGLTGTNVNDLTFLLAF